MTKQNFYESTGPVAGRDVVINPPSSDPESKKQADFYRHAGIWCPRLIRETFEFLMERHGFTAKELRLAWKANSITTDADRESIRIVTPWYEAAGGWAGIFIMLVYFITYVAPLLLGENRNDWRIAVAFAVGSAIYLGMMYVVAHQFLIPRRIAIRVRRALESSK